MKLFGTRSTRQELIARIGRIEQVASTTLMTEDDGPARGSRRVAVRCGDLSFDVHPDRGLDIGALSFRGIPLTWLSPAGVTAPWTAEPSPTGWLKTFTGGLITTCGLDTFGSPSEDDGTSLPLHGQASTLQASHLSQDGRWTRDGDYELVVTGRLRQARTFGENLELYRSIRCRLGAGQVTVEDVVTNLAASPQPLMILYHVNLGWPLLDTASILEIPSTEVIPRDRVAAAGVAEWNSFADPSPGFAEQVFRHDLDRGRSTVEARLTNPELGIALAVRVDPARLPHLFEWKMLGHGTYVLGLEPANCSGIEGRAVARRRGDLPILAPGESREYRVEFHVLAI